MEEPQRMEEPRVEEPRRMVQLIEEIIKENLHEILKGLPFKYEQIEQGNRRPVMAMSLHCAFNGPVGIHKQTKFPLIPGDHRIKDYFPDSVGISNSSWRAFCEEVAKIVNQKFPDIDCSTRRKHKDLWPLHLKGAKT